MARLKKNAIPILRRHKATGQAIDELSGQVFYCGTWSSKTAIAEYDRQVSEWLARGRRPLVKVETTGELMVVELLARYRSHAEGRGGPYWQDRHPCRGQDRTVELLSRRGR